MCEIRLLRTDLCGPGQMERSGQMERDVKIAFIIAEKEIM